MLLPATIGAPGTRVGGGGRPGSGWLHRLVLLWIAVVALLSLVAVAQHTGAFLRALVRAFPSSTSSGASSPLLARPVLYQHLRPGPGCAAAGALAAADAARDLVAANRAAERLYLTAPAADKAAAGALWRIHFDVLTGVGTLDTFDDLQVDSPTTWRLRRFAASMPNEYASMSVMAVAQRLDARCGSRLTSQAGWVGVLSPAVLESEFGQAARPPADVPGLVNQYQAAFGRLPPSPKLLLPTGQVASRGSAALLDLPGMPVRLLVPHPWRGILSVVAAPGALVSGMPTVAAVVVSGRFPDGSTRTLATVGWVGLATYEMAYPQAHRMNAGSAGSWVGTWPGGRILRVGDRVLVVDVAARDPNAPLLFTPIACWLDSAASYGSTYVPAYPLAAEQPQTVLPQPAPALTAGATYAAPQSIAPAAPTPVSSGMASAPPPASSPTAPAAALPTASPTLSPTASPTTPPTTSASPAPSPPATASAPAPTGSAASWLS